MPPAGTKYGDLFERLRDSGASIPTLHCIGDADENRETAEALAACFGARAETLRHDRGMGMPPASWWEQTRGYAERVTGGNRWVTQFKGPWYYDKSERATYL